MKIERKLARMRRNSMRPAPRQVCHVIRFAPCIIPLTAGRQRGGWPRREKTTGMLKSSLIAMRRWICTGWDKRMRELTAPHDQVRPHCTPHPSPHPFLP